MEFDTLEAAWEFLRGQGGLAAGYGYPVPHGGGWRCPGGTHGLVNEALAREAREAAPGGDVWQRAMDATKYAGQKGRWRKGKGK